MLAASALHALRAARYDDGLPRGVGGGGQLEEPLVVGGAVAWNKGVSRAAGPVQLPRQRHVVNALLGKRCDQMCSTVAGDVHCVTHGVTPLWLCNTLYTCYTPIEDNAVYKIESV